MKIQIQDEHVPESLFSERNTKDKFVFLLVYLLYYFQFYHSACVP